MPKRKSQNSVRGDGLPRSGPAPLGALLRTLPRQRVPGQCSSRSWFTSGLQPALVPIQTRAYEAWLEDNRSPPSFMRLRLVCCSWQDSRREILRAKSPSLSSTVNVERRGNRASNTLTGTDGLYNGRSVSRQYQSPSRSCMKYGASAPAVLGLPLSWAILRFMVKGIGRRDCAAFSNAGLFTIRNGARGQTGRQRRPPRSTRRQPASARQRAAESTRI